MSKGDILCRLHERLTEVRVYKRSFWDTIDQLEDDKLVQLYQELVNGVSCANTNVSVHNITISYCTGSHNNCQLLGSLEQAKGAIFYICPYMGKRKYPLQHCLSVISEAVDHTEKYESKAPDKDTNEKRQIQYV